MELIIGGAYQGKLTYAKTVLGIPESEVCDCGAGDIDLSRRCLYHYEQYLYRCAERDEAPVLPTRPDAVVIADDVSCGVVPMDSVVRAWRELCGRTLTAIALQSETVTRLYCGIPKRLKG